MQKTADFDMLRKYGIVEDVIFYWYLPNLILHRTGCPVEFMRIWKLCQLLNSAVKFIQQICCRLGRVKDCD